jgi:hypothetical protein
MPDVAICPQNVEIPALGADIVYNGDRMKFSLETVVWDLFVSWPLLIKQHLRNLVDHDRNRQQSDYYYCVG